MPVRSPRAPAALAAVLFACAAPAEPAGRAAPFGAGAGSAAVPVIVLSAGDAAQGHDRYELRADDLIVIRRSSADGQGERCRTERHPGAHARAAAFLASEGVRIVARQGAPRPPWPGRVDPVAAVPPVGGFVRFQTGCPGGEDAYEALFHGIVAATMLQ